MNIKLSLLFMLLTTTAFSETKKQEIKQYSGVEVNEKNETLKNLLSLPGVSDKYKACQDQYKSPNDLDKIPNCIWSSLDDSQKEKVKAMYAEDQKKAVSAAENNNSTSALKTGLSNKKMDVGIDYSSNPTVKALTDFYQKKLDDVLDPDQSKDKKISTVDHSKFIELYTSELGKSIVNAFTSYCMETPKTCRDTSTCEDKKTDDEKKACYKQLPTCYINKSTKDKNVKENLQILNDANFTDKEGKNWTKCIADVPDVCYKTNASASTSDDDDEDTKSKSYSQQRACIIMDFVKAARKSLIAAGEQKAFYDDLAKNTTASRGIASLGVPTNMNVIDDKNKKATSDQLTQINSSDLQKDFKNVNNQTENIGKVIDQPRKEAEACSKDGKIADQEQCKKFLSTDTDKNTAAVADYGLRQIAEGETLDKKLENDKNVASYLKEEGYSEDEIKNMTKKENIESVKDQIKQRYKNEKDALIKEMASRIGGKTTTTQGKVDDSDAGKMTQIQQELSTRNNDLQQLIHFNNIVSSYLRIQDESSKEVTRNTASLISEANTYTGDGADNLKKNIKNNKDTKDGQDQNSNFKVQDLNSSFLKYRLPGDDSKGK